MNDLELMEEIFEWRDIEGYEGLYKVSEYGDVMSIGYKEKKLLKQHDNGRGYLEVRLCKNGKNKHHRVHRLVATAFCEGADYFPEVNHIDEDKTNNHYSNLEWCTREYNIGYSLNKKVRCVELDIIFESVKAAADYINKDQAYISGCLRGRLKTAGNYHWEYVD